MKANAARARQNALFDRQIRAADQAYDLNNARADREDQLLEHTLDDKRNLFAQQRIDLQRKQQEDLQAYRMAKTQDQAYRSAQDAAASGAVRAEAAERDRTALLRPADQTTPLGGDVSTGRRTEGGGGGRARP